ncbi:hypothetical protein AAZV13_19G079300 [Glycine max]
MTQVKASAKWQNDPSGVCFSRKIMHVLMCIVIRHACWRHMQASDTWNGCRQWKLRNDSVYVASQTGDTVQSSVGRSRHQRAQTRGGRLVVLSFMSLHQIFLHMGLRMRSVSRIELMYNVCIDSRKS